MRNRIAFLVLLACSGVFVSAQTVLNASTQVLTSVPAGRLAHLRRGINASEWFAQVVPPATYSKEHYATHTTARDVALIASMGFDHVRLSVNPQSVFPNRGAREEDFASLDAAVKMILDHGLAVIIDIHPEGDFKARLHDDGFVEEFTNLWRMLARHYSKWDSERIFLEILNEPEAGDRYRWFGIQAKLAAAIRESAPQHTIIAAGARWSADDELIFMEPLADANVIYNFHFYEPHIFTHQGATWGSPFWIWVKGLPYPSTVESTSSVAAGVPDELGKLWVTRYGTDHWNAERIESEVNRVAEWAARRHVAVTCNEFGVYRKYSRAEDRERWTTDVRKALERHLIGWTMWDYAGSFGVVTKTNGIATADEATVRALGLKMPGN
jgi:aryl-phospho-beta-D-glucosidase BglC (GH1 family)